ncbi:apolipoprotein N-acyltransferase [Aliihoeflea sp. 40Bstr573]|uniref:apolipoprotein N-acyltransferase n=1 Tax=Aliihoeflea sp. 40Bstr573 TaxID=2696467 RepID=UPI002094ED83|nr:apolipoprotein N-acyltransferase [Aliihoeflea sp. 40Bstr573]MCO6389131.1 apolipoprotein N-acyltransferase [Aliihoeflea sp. 40Bstr573]
MERLAGKIILLSGAGRALAALAAGALASLSQAPFDFPLAAFIAFPVLVWLLDGAVAAPERRGLRRLGPAFWVGWLFGFGYFLVGLWWTGNALLVEADLFAWALPLAIIGLPALLAFFYAFAAALAKVAWSDDIGRIAALAVAFALAEWLRSVLFTGFPWNAVGYAAMPVPVAMQSLVVLGAVGMNVLAVFVFSLPALLAGRDHLKLGVMLGIGLVALHLGYGAMRLSRAEATDGAETVAIRVIQPSILQSQKWDMAERDRIFQAHLDLTTRPVEQGDAAPDVIIWPETSVPFLFSDRPDALAALGAAINDDQRLLAGIVRARAGSEGGADYYNSIVVIDGSGEIVDAFDKVRLVPFGEYLPFQDFLSRFGLRQLAQNIGGFSAGTTRRPLDLGNGISGLPFICYEVIFPGIAPRGSTDARLLVNVTNDAWFGDTPGPYQHFRQAQFRAVESGLPLVRAANNGISAAVDGYGRVIDGLALDAVGALDVKVPMTSADALVPPFRAGVAGWMILIVIGIAATMNNLRSRNPLN